MTKITIGCIESVFHALTRIATKSPANLRQLTEKKRANFSEARQFLPPWREERTRAAIQQCWRGQTHCVCPGDGRRRRASLTSSQTATVFPRAGLFAKIPNIRRYD